ncbi:SDR family oxidoreductase [uncultured Cellulomonas sp.]|uniref:SDR family NAD(P)-dependent oxidoreductase n=1 Tax=uncultured Cellulomonas sp. TaxID=189682 RepID=UPI0028EA67A6|nr:SDR family oxidoreductase [uncultured Cellulomonas sp.]
MTGGSDGIGRELVVSLLARGARVAAVGRSVERLRGTVVRAGYLADRLSTHAVDVTDRAAVESLPDAVIHAHGQVDGLINCAGVIQPFVPLLDLDYADLERMMAVNFWGPVHTIKAFLPHLVTRPVAHVVNVSSVGGFLPVQGQTAYGASKAALKLLTEGLHSELVGTSVAVTLVLPGAVRTNIALNSGVEVPRMSGATAARLERSLTTAPAAARIIVDAVERDAYRVTVGKDATFVDLLSRLAPELAARLVRAATGGLLGQRASR